MDAQQRRLLGLETDADRKVTIPIRHWEAMRLALWRSKVAWEAVLPQARLILDQCGHADGCPGITSESEPCGPDCPDRERRLSVLVIMAAAKQFAPLDARRPADGVRYIAPSRERFSEVLAELAAAQLELDVLHARGYTETPPPHSDAPPQLSEGQ
jgi:hypothetical protein